MLCAQARELISARLDGEDVPDQALDDHLEGCAECRSYAGRAAHVTRLTRMRVAEPGPDLVAAVVAAAAARRGAGAVRWGLVAVGVGQCALAVSGLAEAGDAHGGIAVASAAHMSHESAAWNLALGVGFLWVAAGPVRRGSGLVAVVGAFVVVLAALSALDLIAGQVDPVRLAMHALVVIGFALLLVQRRSEPPVDGGADAGQDPDLRYGPSARAA